MKLKRGIALWAAMILAVFLIQNETKAQNPTFGGQQFKKVWTDGDIPQGANGSPRITSASKLHLTSAGLYLDSSVYESGIYYFDDSGAYAVAIKNQPGFSGASFAFIGAKPDGSMIIRPVFNGNLYPCQIYDGNGLSAISSPTPEQGLNQDNYFDGRFVYLEHAGLGAVNIWYYTEGNPAQLWFDNSDYASLATLDYDGDTLAFVGSNTGTYDIRLRDAGGALTYIIGQGDPLPGTVASTYTGTPVGGNVEVDQGKVYVLGAGSGGEHILFSSSNGVAFDIIATVGQVVPSLTGITISGMALRQVRDGKIWLQVSQSNGDIVLYQIVGGVWNRVAGKSDSYNGRVPIGFGTYEHGSSGDTVVIAVQHLDFSSPTIYETEIYVNGDLPGFTAALAGLPMQIILQPNGYLTISALGDVGETNTLQSTSSLTNTFWDTDGTVVADGAGLMEWSMSPTNHMRFYRLVE